jgi:hypothetical protein
MGPDNLVNVKTFLSHGDKKKRKKISVLPAFDTCHSRARSSWTGPKEAREAIHT